MSSPRFSIVIPTREGARTLRSTLQTCLNQSFEDFEVVVGDNCSSPATREVVESFASPRIHYVRSDTPLSMSSNWELAVSRASGEFVTVLGDDDGLLPHSLAILDRVLLDRGTDAVRWDGAFYLWPDIALPGEGNYLKIPLSNTLQIVNSREVIAAVAAYDRCYTALPMLYNAVVRRELLTKVRNRVGKLFHNRYPDFCSGFLVAGNTETYASLTTPLTVAGLSHKSIGVGLYFRPGQSAVGDEFLRLNTDEGIALRRVVPDLQVFPVIPVADSFEVVKELLFPDDFSLCLDRRAMINNCVWCLRTDSPEQWAQCMAIIRGTLADDPSLEEWFDATLADYPPSTSGPLRLRGQRLGYDGEFLHLNADEFGVTDVAGAARLCEKILRQGDPGFAPQTQSSSWVRESEAMHLQLREKEAKIHELTAIAAERLKVLVDLDGRLKHSEAERLRGGPLLRALRKLGIVSRKASA